MDLVETFFNTGSMLLSTKEKTLVSRPFLKIMFIVFNSLKNIKIKIKRHIYLNLRNDNCGHLCILLLDNLTNNRLVKSRTIHKSLHDEWINEKYKQLLNFF